MGRPSKTSPVWVSTQVLANALCCSKDHVHDLREHGLFKQGLHWRDISRPGAVRSTYRWHLKNCEDALSIPSELR